MTIRQCIPEIGGKMPRLFDSMWFCYDLDPWGHDLKIYSVHLYAKMHQSCKFGEIPTSNF